VRPLGDLEAQVMRRIWERGQPVTVRDVVDDLQRDRSIAYTTVMTVMGNLCKKGWLRRQADGRAYRYEATVSGAEYSAGLMRQALSASADRSAVLLRFVEQMSAEEASALAAAYQQLTGKDAP
jgi:predicted transcriptional regulator